MILDTTIAVIDDNKDILDFYKRYLSLIDNTVIHTFRNPNEAVVKIIENKYDIVITDNIMPKHDGIWVAKKIVENYRPKIVLTSVLPSKILTEDDLKNFDKCIYKPFDPEVLKVLIKDLIDEINIRKKAIVDKITKEFLIDVHGVEKESLSIENVVKALMYDMDQPHENSIYVRLNNSLEKCSSTLGRNRGSSKENIDEPSLLQDLFSLKKKPKNKAFIDRLMEKNKEKEESERW